MKQTPYSLPELNYEYDELWPYISEEQLRTHYAVHHQGYVNKANHFAKELSLAGSKNELTHLESLTQNLSFNLSGHILHSLFWENLQPAPKTGEIPASLTKRLEADFRSVENFKQAFEQLAKSVQGSGWAALIYQPEADRLSISQIEKHQLNVIPNTQLIMVLDVWEHAYYLDYRSNRAKYVSNFWEIINWDTVDSRLSAIRR